MDLGLHFGDVIGPFVHGLGFLVEGTTEVFVAPLLQEFVVVRDFRAKDLPVKAVGLGERVGVGELLDAARREHLFERARTEFFEVRDAVGIGDRKGLSALVDDREETVGEHLAVAEFVHETLSVEARDVDPEERPRDRREVRGNPHAFFHGRAVGKTLNPVGLDDVGADAARFAPAFRRGARLIGRLVLGAQLRIEPAAVVDVRTEAAEGEHHAAARPDRAALAGRGLAKFIAFAHDDALHAPVRVPNDGVENRAAADFDAELREALDRGLDDALPRALFRDHAAKSRMAAFAREIRLPSDAHFLARPFKGVRRVLAEEADVFGVAEALTDAHHVGFEGFGLVFDPLLVLHGRIRHGDHAARKRAVAADEGHLFDDQNVRPRELGGERRGKSRKARAHDHDVVHFVEFRGHRIAAGGLRRERRRARQDARRGGSEEFASIGGDGHSFLFFVKQMTFGSERPEGRRR